MAMTKKYYELVAGVLNAARTVRCSEERTYRPAIVNEIALGLAREFAADNPRFDRERFMQACGLKGVYART